MRVIKQQPTPSAELSDLRRKFKECLVAGSFDAAQRILADDELLKLEIAQAKNHILASGYSANDGMVCVLAISTRADSQLRQAAADLIAARMDSLVSRMDKLDQRLSATSKQLAALGRASSKA